VEEDQGLTIPQVAERLGKSARQVIRYILEGTLQARTIQGKFGPEYRVDIIPEALYKTVKDRKTGVDQPEAADKEQTQLALQMLDSITGEYKAKIQELEAVNLNLAIELGKERARREDLERQFKQLPGGREARPKSLLERILRRVWHE
jgi:hypothetical protein